MSSPIALPSPEASASRAAPTAPPAGPERTLQAPAAAASAGGGDAPRGLHHQRRRQPARRGRLAEPLQVTAEERRQIGVDRRRRAALVLAHAGQHLVRGRDVDPGELAAQVLGQTALVRGVEVGEEQADRDRLRAGAADRLGQTPRLIGSERVDHSVRADPLVRLEAHRRLDQWLRLRRAEPVEVGAVLTRDLEQVAEAAGGDQRGARAPFLEQGIGPDRHPVGEGLDLVGGRTGPSQDLLDDRHHRDGLVVQGRRQLRGVDPLAVEEDGVGERSSNVDAQEHGLTLAGCRSRRPGLAPRLVRPSTMWTRSSSGSIPGKSVRRWPPRDSRRSPAQMAIAAASG